MRRGLELALVIALVGVGAAWSLRAPLRTAAWTVRGGWELMWLPSFSPLPAEKPPARVAHAGGSLRGMRYTNAVEAVEANYARGARWFEVDFLAAADGELWAVHEWAEVSHAPFRISPLREMLAWFDAHPDARLITDTKGDNGALLRRLATERAALRARIHPQIYRMREYAQARAAGFGAPIFTTYRSAYPWWLLRRFVRQYPVMAVTVTVTQAHDACAELCGQIALLTHTVNDESEAASLLRSGIAGVYTDDLLP